MMKDFIELAAKYFENFFTNILRLIADPKEFASAQEDVDKPVGEAMIFFILSTVVVQFIRLPMFSGHPEITSMFLKDITWKTIFFMLEAMVVFGLLRAFGGKGGLLQTVALSAYFFGIINVVAHVGVLLAYSIPDSLPCLSWERRPDLGTPYTPLRDICSVFGHYDSGTIKDVLYRFGQAIKGVYLLFGLSVVVWLVFAWRAYAVIHDISSGRANGALVAFVFAQPIMLGIGGLLLLQSGII
ncbi:hypothetical protein IVA88_22675 [Bradyrhizobium sp. 149]|uniref:YIP1 family protein n=1 Tax=Bradyrhizobium sp. 149 TaxID=2782624 RepID=UPI001FFC28F6|nr:YIP1 family protein [Bradyrhizobium sp. 149]MCK1654222.1 hypothetical protein [Bradyrhizobium sp. 149]